MSDTEKPRTVTYPWKFNNVLNCWICRKCGALAPEDREECAHCICIKKTVTAELTRERLARLVYGSSKRNQFCCECGFNQYLEPSVHADICWIGKALKEIEGK